MVFTFGGKYCLILCWIILAAIHSSIRNSPSSFVINKYNSFNCTLFSFTLIYTQGRGLVIIGVASITVIRQYATLIVTTKMIRHTSCRTIGVAYSCILKAWNGDCTSKLLSNCNTSKVTSSFYLLFSHKVMRSLEKFNTTTTAIIIQQLRPQQQRQQWPTAMTQQYNIIIWIRQQSTKGKHFNMHVLV